MRPLKNQMIPTNLQMRSTCIQKKCTNIQKRCVHVQHGEPVLTAKWRKGWKIVGWLVWYGNDECSQMNVIKWMSSMWSDTGTIESTGWRRLIGCLKLKVTFCKRATNYRALLRKMTQKDKAPYDSTPALWLYATLYTYSLSLTHTYPWAPALSLSDAHMSMSAWWRLKQRLGAKGERRERRVDGREAQNIIV